MKFLKSLILSMLVIFGFSMAKVEAAKVAVLPLINKVVFNTVEEEKIPNMIFYDEALGILRSKPGYMLIENDRLRHAIENNTKPYEMPTKEQLETIAKKANVDILIAMQLDSYRRVRLNKGQNEMFMQMDVRARLVTYNRLTGKFVQKRVVDDRPYDATLESRYDKVQEAWQQLVRQEMHRLTGGNKSYR